MSVSAVILGSGTSHGIPMIGCECHVCSSPDPRDHRMRASLYVEIDGLRVLIDTGPELRIQCVANQVREVDAVLFTHHHADHVTGLDDLRRFNWIMKRNVPCYGNARTLKAIRQMFAYAFHQADDSPHSRPHIELIEIGDQSFEINGRAVTPIPLIHGTLPVLGFRFSNLAYCTDCSMIPDESIDLLQGLEVLILDALRHTPHPAHFHLEKAIAVARQLGAGETYFTHLAHEIKHAEVQDSLPDGMNLAYDGLRLQSR
ncbi:MAG: MBL fold metallo-hydrolase [Planctomycetota bacterium]